MEPLRLLEHTTMMTTALIQEVHMSTALMEAVGLKPNSLQVMGQAVN